MTSAFSTYDVAAVMIHGWANVPGFDCMMGPCVTGSRFGMSMDFDSRWRYGVAVEVETAMDGFPGGELRGNSGPP